MGAVSEVPLLAGHVSNHQHDWQQQEPQHLEACNKFLFSFKTFGVNMFGVNVMFQNGQDGDGATMRHLVLRWPVVDSGRLLLKLLSPHRL